MFGFEIRVSVTASQSDAREQFETAALPHLNRLYRTAVRLLGDRTRAEDVVQDVYLHAWKYFHRFELGTDCAAWLFKIMFNTIHHHRRKWLKAEVVAADDAQLEQVLVYTPPILEEISDEDILASMMAPTKPSAWPRFTNCLRASACFG
jgi:RNA polymerase sigma-70 factor, ECF subfamily